MGKGQQQAGEQATAQQTAIAQQTADLAKGLVTESDPARKQALSTYSGLARGNVPGITQFTAPQTQAATQQFGLARSAMMGMAPGGARDAALRNLSLSLAGQKTGIYSGGVSESLARLASAAYGGTQSGIGAYGQAGQGFGQAAQNYYGASQMSAQRWDSAMSGIGGLVGK